MKKIIICFLILFLSSNSAYAIYGGTDASGDKNVITFSIGKDSRNSYCSGALISENIAVTAAHCFAKPSTNDGSTILDASSYWVVLPGNNIMTDDISTRVQVDKIIFTKGYDNTWNLSVNNRSSTIDDIAFIVLKSYIKLDKKNIIATDDDILDVKKNNDILRIYGYGLYDFNKVKGSPSFIELKSRSRKFYYELDHPAQENKTIIGDEDGTMAVCPGDSGGPVYINSKGIMKLAAVVIGGSGCSGQGPYSGGAFATLIHPYLYLINSIDLNNTTQLTNKNMPVTIKCKRGKSIITIIRKNAKCMRGWSEIK